MTEEEIQALKAAKEEAERRASEAEALAKAKEAEADKARGALDGVVNELKEERQKKNEALNKAQISNNPLDVTSEVERVLQEKESERRKAELMSAVEEFKSAKTEFANDSTGLLFEKFKQGLSAFNLSDIKSKDEAKKVLERIYAFQNFKEPAGDNDYGGTPSSINSAPSTVGQIPRDMDKVLESVNIDRDKFTKLQTKYPDALDGLGI